MRRVALAIALVVLTGCGGAQTKVETPPPAAQAPSQTQPQTQSPPQTPAPAPAPAPVSPPVDLCDQKIPLAERQQALAKLVADQGPAGLSAAKCLRAEVPSQANVALITGPWDDTGRLVAFARKTNGAWEAKAIPAPAGGWGVSDSINLLQFTRAPNLLLVGISSGTGGYAQLFQVVEGTGGALVTTAVTDVYEKAWFRFIEPDLVFLNFRGNPGPQAWECNACLTANNQLLWRWDGKQLTKVGERVWSEPYLTVNLMLGALRSGDTKAAAPYVTDPALIEQAAKLIGKDVMSWQANFWTEAYGKIQDAERTNWDLLPASVRTPVSVTKYDVTLTKDSQKVIFHTTRTDKGWLVSGIN